MQGVDVMADIKWIKLATGVFDNRKIRQIESLPDGDSIIVIWFKLLCLAGEINDSGQIYFTKEIPYTEQMISSQFNRPLTTVQIAMRTFEQFGMIEIVDDILHISNWEKYQNVEGMDRIREQTRKRVARYRERQKSLPEPEIEPEDDNVSCNVTVTQGNETDKNKIRKEEDKNRIEEEKKRIDYNGIKDAYNSLCPSLPSVKSLSDARKKAIKARLNTYSEEDLKTAFMMAEESDFLKGRNDRNWTANFDWIMKDANLAKILDGNYNNTFGNHSTKADAVASRVSDIDNW